MRITRTYPKAIFYCPTGNAITSADWRIPQKIFVPPPPPPPHIPHDSWGVSWVPSWGVSWVH